MSSHPTDSVARLCAHDATFNSLVLTFEDIVGSGQSIAYRCGALQSFASLAVARVELLERRLSDLTVVPDNVVPMRAPATTRDRSGA